jgi:DeoR family fructose operon transcriptional repressor
MTEDISTLFSTSSDNIDASPEEERLLLTIERRRKMVDLVNIHKTVSVADMMEWLGASPATVRRDFVWLEKQGLIVRTRGGVLALDHTMPRGTAPNYERRLHEYVDEKRAIGQLAAESIKDGETIMLDSSSTNHYMLPFLAHKQNLTVITNSLHISQELVSMAEVNPSLGIICSGGTVFMRTHSLVGMMAEQTLKQFFVDKAFIGVRGLSVQHGITSPFLEELSIKRQMIHAARYVFVLADHTKFNLTSTGLIAPISIVHTIITDAHITSELAQLFRDAGPRVDIAPLNDTSSL